MASHDNNSQSVRLRLWTLIGLLIACFLFGGASRNDVLSLAALQPLAVLCAATFLLSPGPIRWASVRVPLLLLGALAAIMAAQLVPLPPDVWSQLPGHAQFIESAEIAGIAQPWRGISLTPDLTLAGLVGLVTPVAVLIGFASVPPERTHVLLPVMIGAIGLSALIGLAQVAGGPGSSFYFYETTNSDSPVGFFSNRNHQAVALATAWPMLAVWATLPAEPKFFAAKRWVAVSLAVFLLPMLLATGSRAGLALGALGLVTAWLLWRRQDPATPSPDRWSPLLVPVGLGASICVVAASMLLSRDVAFERITGISFDDESRLQYLPTLLEMTRDFFPLGAGFGGFDPLFRAYEPFALLRPNYLNHAHNDLVELVLSGGLPAVAILIAFLLWLGLRARAVLRSAPGRSIAFARLGLLIIVTVLLSSLVDYPLRTPLMAALFTVACGWLSVYERRGGRGTG